MTGALHGVQVRRALLESDVSLMVVRRFVRKVEEVALGQEVRAHGSDLVVF